jgi:hypothetical protein
MASPPWQRVLVVSPFGAPPDVWRRPRDRPNNRLGPQQPCGRTELRGGCVDRLRTAAPGGALRGPARRLERSIERRRQFVMGWRRAFAATLSRKALPRAGRLLAHIGDRALPRHDIQWRRSHKRPGNALMAWRTSPIPGRPAGFTSSPWTRMGFSTPACRTSTSIPAIRWPITRRRRTPPRCWRSAARIVRDRPRSNMMRRTPAARPRSAQAGPDNL